jgi:hypothetical protein
VLLCQKYAVVLVQKPSECPQCQGRGGEGGIVWPVTWGGPIGTSETFVGVANGSEGGMDARTELQAEQQGGLTHFGNIV